MSPQQFLLPPCQHNPPTATPPLPSVPEVRGREREEMWVWLPGPWFIFEFITPPSLLPVPSFASCLSITWRGRGKRQVVECQKRREEKKKGRVILRKGGYIREHVRLRKEKKWRKKELLIHWMPLYFVFFLRLIMLQLSCPLPTFLLLLLFSAATSHFTIWTLHSPHTPPVSPHSQR